MKAPKKPEDDLFDRLNVPTLNTYLKNFMPGLTAKTFRTSSLGICNCGLLSLSLGVVNTMLYIRRRPFLILIFPSM